MALTGTISATNNEVNCTVSLTWQRISTQNNTSIINWSLKITNKSSKDFYGLSNDKYEVVIDDRVYSGYVDSSITAGATKELASGTQNIIHLDNGNKTFNYSFTQGLGKSLSIINRTVSASGTATLDAIPKIATLLTAQNFTDEDNPTITYNNAAGDTLTSLQACIADSVGNVIYVPYRDISKTGSSYTFNLTVNERNALRAAITGDFLSVRFYIKSVYGTQTSYRYLDRTMKLEEAAPTLSAIARDNDTNIIELTGDYSKIILGFSDIYYIISATAPQGATIASRTAKCGAQTYNTMYGTFKDAETNIVELSATDSRGNTSSKTIELDVIPYIQVSCNQNATLNLDGSIALTIYGNYFSGSFGAKNNTLTIEARFREQGKEWGEWEDITATLADASGGTYILNTTITGYDYSGTYELQARATDKLTSALSRINTITLTPVFDWGKNDFNFNVPITIEGNKLNDFVIETGTSSMGSNGTWYWRKWKSGRAECYGCRNFGTMAITTAWGNLYRSEYFRQALPSGLFVDAPEVIDINYRSSNYGAWVAAHESYIATPNYTNGFILVRPASATLSQSYIGFNVIGRWK